MTQSIAILILFYNKLDQTKDCINSFLPSGQKIYVLNNGSDLKQWKQLQSEYEDNSSIVLFDAGENLGPSGGRNYLISHTNESWMAFIDSDIIIQPIRTWVQIFFEFLEKESNARIVCPLIYNVHENSYMKKLQMTKKGDHLFIETRNGGETNFFPEGGVIAHRSIFETYGLYDENLFAFEGYEFSLRAMKSNDGEFKVYHINEIELIHDHRFQKSSRDKEAVRQRYNEEKIKASYEYLVSKYNIVFEHDWQWWTRKQVVDMTKSKWFSTVKERIKKVLNR